MFSALFKLTNMIAPIFDVASSVFALVFYLFVAGLGVYAVGLIVYQVVEIHRRHKAERPEPPVARQGPTIYPNGKGGENR